MGVELVITLITIIDIVPMQFMGVRGFALTQNLK